MTSPLSRPAVVEDERTQLVAWLDLQRALVHVKCAGLSERDAHRPLLPTSPAMTPAGLVSHLRWVEHCWFEVLLLDRPKEVNPQFGDVADADFSVGDVPLAVIFIGAVFQICLMVAVIVGGVRMELIEAAYTLGAKSRGVVLRVMLPAAAPQIFETLRLVLGWAWTYVIVAELIGASAGIGFMIIDAQRFLDTGQMIFGIFVIGVIGLVSDFLFKQLNQRLFSWAAS